MVVFRNALVLFLICGHAFLFAESAPGTDAQPARPEAATAATTNAPVQKAAEDYYVETRGYGLKRVDGTRPSYAKKLSETGIAAFQNLSWLVAGIEQRTRYEYRENDFRRPNIANPQNIPGGEKPPLDQPVLFKTRLFLKVEDILDPFRFTVEMQDSRRTAAYYGVDDRDVNELEPIQAFGELHLKHMCGQNRPLVIRAGRMAFEFLDRRLIGFKRVAQHHEHFSGSPRHDRPGKKQLVPRIAGGSAIAALHRQGGSARRKAMVLWRNTFDTGMVAYCHDTALLSWPATRRPACR